MSRRVITILLAIVSILFDVFASGANAQFVRTNANNYFINDSHGAYGFTQISDGPTKGLMFYYNSTPTPPEMWTPEKVSEAVFIAASAEGDRASSLVLPGEPAISIEGDFSFTIGDTDPLMSVTIAKEGYISVSIGDSVIALRGLSVIASSFGSKARELLSPQGRESYRLKNGKLMFGNVVFDASKIGVIRERTVSPCEQGAVLLSESQYEKFGRGEPLETLRSQMLQLQRGETSQAYGIFSPVFINEAGVIIAINTKENGRLYHISRETEFEGVPLCVARDVKIN